MTDIERALSDIADIRTQIADSKRFRGFGPSVVALTGCLALALATLQHIWPSYFAESELQFIAFWIALAFLAVILIGSELIARSRREHGELADAMMSNTIEQFLPAGMAGAALTFLIFKTAPDTVWMLPGLWQILLALGVLAGLKSLPRTVTLAGGWYFLSGIASFAVASQAGTLSPWLMGIPFCIGQFLMAASLFLATEAGHDQDR